MAGTVYNPNTMSASDVKTMQNALIKAGYSVGKSGADGIWGPDTAAALSQFKADNGRTNTNGNSIGDATFKILYDTGGNNTSSASSSTPANYVVRAGDIGYNADVANKAAAYISGGTYTPGQAINTDWWGAGGGKAQMYGNDKTYKGLAMTEKDMQVAAYYADLYDQEQAKAQQEAQLAQQEAMWNKIYEMQERQNAQNQQASQQRTQQLVNSIRGNETDINNAYKEAQRQAYINQALQKSQMGDYLSANGYTGGMAESTLAQLATNYENNRRNAASERDAALRQNEKLIAEAQASGNSELADIANNYMSQAIAAMQNQAQMNYQLVQAQQAQANSDREYKLALAQQQLVQKQYEDELAASKANDDLNTFLATYKGMYNNPSDYSKWLLELKNGADPYDNNAAKIAYINQYLNSGALNQGASNNYTKSSSNSRSSSKAKTATTTTNSPSTIANYDQVLKSAALIKSTNSFYGPQGAADYIEKSGLTDSEKNKAFKALGLL